MTGCVGNDGLAGWKKLESFADTGDEGRGREGEGGGEGLGLLLCPDDVNIRYWLHRKVQCETFLKQFRLGGWPTLRRSFQGFSGKCLKDISHWRPFLESVCTIQIHSRVAVLYRVKLLSFLDAPCCTVR